MNMRSVTGRIFAAFMGAALIIGNLGFSVAGYADESEDKTVLEMKAEKEVYKEGEIVKTIFSVRNDNAVKLVDVKATGVAPEGYAVKSVNGPSEIASGEKADYIIEFEDTDVIHTFATKQKVDISSCFGTGETIAKYAITDKSQKKLARVNKKGLVSCKKPGE
ncbi:MAG: hypothetical protein II799_07220, partial [Lachnospiraceae bacterium]|nr:hypothetical protein [Lachnospiraceae bacterium]